ncbi:hypothetical protein QOZ80_UnG0724250 [Eleusine coracana subsp. coracana]|uniref:Uncharacterized protein n=1 Tax=Eleusine coracana subsp. coracana TaxID=191504 RepID=A0AAV9FZK0_ELECO|nr:hypothetical protein QOZ80_UnG0724250 [Eleusine coracana subsp. coracana]
MQTSLMVMATTFPVQPQQSSRLSAAAPVVSGPSVTSWRRRGHSASRCLRVQRNSALHSAQARSDHLDTVDGDGLNPCGFHPSIWGDFFLHHSNPADFDEQQAWMLKRTEVLKEEVRSIISRSITPSLHQRLHLIETIERLCLDYLFEEEISIALAEASTADVNDCDLQTVALWFYLLRKHGYRVSSDVFVRFRDEEGRFLAHTPMDLLNLYNAASLRTHGDIVLDEAALFTRKKLETALPSMEGSLAREIKFSLEIPLPRRVSIYDSKDQILKYENEDIVDEAVIQLAKLNSNIMQLHYQRELEIITRWWKDLDIESQFPFARDRIVECFLWMLGVYFEPCYSRGRIILTMVIAIIVLIDDIYDSYGTAEDCKIFTKCMESWDLNAANDLPECMKFALRKIFHSYHIIEDELANAERYRMLYLRNFTLDLVRCFNTEVKMRDDGYVPKSVEEHLQVSLRSGGCHLLSCASLVGMDDIATKDSFDWISSMPKMVTRLCIILRLLDDLQTYEREQKMTLHVASTIHSYMKEHNVSIEIAREKVVELKEETWKDFNAEWLNPENSQPKQILNRIFNLARTMEFFYNKDDNFTNCHNIKDKIHSLFVEPFTIM